MNAATALARYRDHVLFHGADHPLTVDAWNVYQDACAGLDLRPRCAGCMGPIEGEPVVDGSNLPRHGSCSSQRTVR